MRWESGNFVFNIADFIVLMMSRWRTCATRMTWCCIQEVTVILQVWSKLGWGIGSYRPVYIEYFQDQSFDDTKLENTICPLTSNQLQQPEVVKNIEKPYATFNCWMGTPGGQWLAWVDAENEQKIWTRTANFHHSMLEHGLKSCGLGHFVLQRRLHLEWISGSLLQVNGIPTKGGN